MVRAPRFRDGPLAFGAWPEVCEQQALRSRAGSALPGLGRAEQMRVDSRTLQRRSGDQQVRPGRQFAERGAGPASPL
ncbi:hypothetical protein O1M54_00625 [Streptomyces diastatochromogenes]|nr:hypothetical protein [Streptomyces diastatochromogenes]